MISPGQSLTIKQREQRKPDFNMTIEELCRGLDPRDPYDAK